MSDRTSAAPKRLSEAVTSASQPTGEDRRWMWAEAERCIDAPSVSSSAACSPSSLLLPLNMRTHHGVLTNAATKRPQVESQASHMTFCNAGSTRPGRGCPSSGSDCHNATTSRDGRESVCRKSVGATMRYAMASAMRFRLRDKTRCASSAQVRSLSSTSFNCSCRWSYTSATDCRKLRGFRAGNNAGWLRMSRQRAQIPRTSSSATEAHPAFDRSQRFSNSTIRVRGSRLYSFDLARRSPPNWQADLARRSRWYVLRTSRAATRCACSQRCTPRSVLVTTKSSEPAKACSAGSLKFFVTNCCKVSICCGGN
mmetsp:Transcript_5836/g.16471  ORF Transcript_5836/g.16471 Transcript_5836/m.16471 type:complete len:311 (-) Transcript_5836:126-1058(-)